MMRSANRNHTVPITDKEGLNKKQNKLARVSGKFRRETIDRKDYLFNKFAELLK